ncbi:DegV family protein [Haloplasma contractile]|uniref:DegV domain protein n=1 Tax=Haloplasma contractile SSD-17B TaxID=1033810 RepID=F7PV53_9MOLU|nr:DegV family protein [Haloplasma contractile]ERJ10979.1 DegV domain protein [Haloplasma contractile SSD-17B]
MNKVQIFSDSTCDLSKEVIAQYNIKIIPLYVSFGEDTYQDGIDINTKQLYKQVERSGCLPKTAAPSPGVISEYFKPYIEQEMDLVYIGISSKLSSTIQNALIAAKEFEEGRVHVVDSLNLSTGIGLLVLKAAKFASNGVSAINIANNIRNLVPNVKTAFVIDTLDYLHKGGRCSGVQHFVTSMLKIKPIIHVIDGQMSVGAKPRGKKKALSLLLNMIKNDENYLDPDFVMVTHSEAPEAAIILKDALSMNKGIDTVLETEAGCVISSHCGKGTIGILYITK